MDGTEENKKFRRGIFLILIVVFVIVGINLIHLNFDVIKDKLSRIPFINSGGKATDTIKEPKENNLMATVSFYGGSVGDTFGDFVTISVILVVGIVILGIIFDMFRNIGSL